MTNNANIRQQLNLLTSNQAQVQYGNLLSLPFGDGMLYVEPVYVKSNQTNAYPLLQRVLVSYGDGGQYVVLANSLQEGIKQLVELGKQADAATPPPPPPPAGENPTSPTPPPSSDTPPQLTPELAAAATKVQTAIGEVKAAQASGDFERYGRALKALDAAMTEFQNAQRPTGAGRPNPGASPTPAGSPPASGGTPSPPAQSTG
jgi:uncharacterized membrane protein (UPF0182 family)